MRHHFHRCANLRVIEIPISDLSRARKGGSQIVDELCEARQLAPCVGLAECDVLSSEQKRELLVARATSLRQGEGGRSSLADTRDPRSEELSLLQEELSEERREIAETNRRARAEAGAALRRNPQPVSPSEAAELPIAAAFVAIGDELRELRMARLDALDRALDVLAHGGRFECVRCQRPIELARLREAPDTAVCSACAAEALPPDPLPGPPPQVAPEQAGAPPREVASRRPGATRARRSKEEGELR